MREIKLRAWVGGVFIYSGPKGQFGPRQPFICAAGTLEFFDITTCKTIEQYTGLKDKNGVEIYEGDVIKIKVSNALGDYQVLSEVAYSESKGAFHAMGTTTDHLGDFIFGVTGVNNCEVIGNIHENPELLK